MPFPTKLLNDGEEVVLDLHPHWWYFAGRLLVLLIAIGVGLFVLSRELEPWVDVAAGVAVLAALVWFGVRYARWVTTNFVVTTDRLIYRHGVVAKHGIEIPLDRVNTVIFGQSLVERMLGAGDLTIESAGERGSQSFSDVRKPSAVQNEIYRQMEANENRKFDRIGAGGVGGGPGLTTAEQLEKLDDLRTRGVLSEEEFQAEKRRLLG